MALADNECLSGSRRTEEEYARAACSAEKFGVECGEGYGVEYLGADVLESAYVGPGGLMG